MKLDYSSIGHGWVSGYSNQESFSLEPKRYAALQFTFLAVTEAYRMEWLQPDGILGLGPIPKYDYDVSILQSYVMDLKFSKIIENAVFSIYIHTPPPKTADEVGLGFQKGSLSSKYRKSKIQFGGQDIKLIEKCWNGARKHNKNSNKKDGVFWLENNSEFKWSLALY